MEEECEKDRKGEGEFSGVILPSGKFCAAGRVIRIRGAVVAGRAICIRRAAAAGNAICIRRAAVAGRAIRIRRAVVAGRTICIRRAAAAGNAINAAAASPGDPVRNGFPTGDQGSEIAVQIVEP